MKYFGVDFGRRKIGLAVGEDTTRIAVPFGLLPGGDDAAFRLSEFAKSEGAEAFVVGLPIPTEAHQSEEQLERTVAFMNELADLSGLPIFVVDEQFTSAEARRVQKEYGATAEEDALAAMLILQAYLDELPNELSV